MNKLKDNQQHIYFIKYEIETTDYLTAIFQLKSKIEKICDFYIYNDQLTFHNDIIVKNGLTVQTYDLDKIWKTTFSNQWYINDTKNAFELDKLVSKFNSNSKETILQSLRYLKIGSNTQNIEQKILNYWISLESLFSWHKSDSILNAMQNFIPYFTFIDEIRTRINFIKNILKKYTPNINEIIIKRLDIKETEYIKLNNSELLKIINSKDDFNRLLDDLKKMNYAKSLIIEQQNIFKDIDSSFKNHQKDCEITLKRIYHYRNKIAHLGHYEKIPTMLILKLQSYIYSCYYSLALNNHSFHEIENSDISGSFELTKLLIQKNLNKNIFDLF